MVVPRAARASLSGAFRAGSGKEGGVGRIGGRAAVAAGGAGVAHVRGTALRCPDNRIRPGHTGTTRGVDWPAH